MRSTFVVYVDDRPGVLDRVASLCRRRAFNIESLSVGSTEQHGVSRMTVVVDTDEYGARRLEAHLYKLVHVRLVQDITVVPCISRDLAFIKVRATADHRPHLLQLLDVYRARVVDVCVDSLIVETTGAEDEVDSLVDVLRPYGIVEMARSGRVSMCRGTAAVSQAPRPGPLATRRDAGDSSA